MKKILYAVLAIFATAVSMPSCVDDELEGDSYYTFTGEMVTDFLEHREGTFSDFIAVLKRANLWDLLSTYGEFTCFAPTNDAIQDFLRVQGASSVDQLDQATCDTLAWQHIIKASYFTTDLSEGTIPTTNMNNRYVTMSQDPITATYLLNGSSEMIAYDDSVKNGVVHIISRVLSTSSIFISDAIIANPKTKIFGQALELTHLSDTLSLFQDLRYSCSIDSTTLTNTSPHHRIFGNNDVYWRYPQSREYKWTVFVETDSVLARYKINDLEDLKKYAKKIYDNTYPEDAGKYDTLYTHRKNPLNRFIAYHILDRYASYSEMTVSATVFGNAVNEFRTDCQDIMEFYETLCPYTIMKISDAAGHKWVNRRGLGRGADRYGYYVEGCRILSPSEAGHSTDELNGVYHYIDKPLVYDKENTIDKVLNCRMRIDATTLSPDFMNAGARNSNPATYNVGFYMTGFKSAFTKNFIFSDNTFFGVHNRFYCNSWENDMCACLDNFDIKFRLPPVPAGQTYEVRLGYVCGAARTVVQVYFDDNLTADIPCGIPIDLRKYAPEYGWVSDTDLANDPEAIEDNDKALRNQGFMKGLAGAWFADLSSLPRDQVQCLRRILTTQYFEPEHDYYIRLRQVLENQAEMSLDYIEIVPKSVYDGPISEDQY